MLIRGRVGGASLGFGRQYLAWSHATWLTEMRPQEREARPDSLQKGEQRAPPKKGALSGTGLCAGQHKHEHSL